MDSHSPSSLDLLLSVVSDEDMNSFENDAYRTTIMSSSDASDDVEALASHYRRSLKAMKASSKPPEKYPHFNLLHRLCRLIIKKRRIEDALRKQSLKRNLRTFQAFLSEMLHGTPPSSPTDRLSVLREILHPSVAMSFVFLSEQKTYGLAAVSDAFESIRNLLGVSSVLRETATDVFMTLDVGGALYNEAGTKIRASFRADLGQVALNGSICGVYSDDLLVSVDVVIRKA